MLVKPEDVSETVWSDFLTIRKAKRAPLTATALEGIEREAAKAGMSLHQALQVCCARGWQGFKAEWATSAPASSPHQPINRQEALEARNRAAVLAALAQEAQP